MGFFSLDSRRRVYVLHGGLRITFVPGDERKRARHWPGRSVARIEHEGVEHESEAPFEVLADSPGSLMGLIAALRAVFNEGGRQERLRREGAEAARGEARQHSTDDVAPRGNLRVVRDESSRSHES